MTVRRRIFLALSSFSVMCFLVLFYINSRASYVKEPEHDGVRAGEWLDRYLYYNTVQRPAIFHAFRGMGTNAAPYLCFLLQRNESNFEIVYNRLFEKFPGIIRFSRIVPYRDRNRKIVASMVLNELGTNAIAAIPTMLKVIPSVDPNAKNNLIDAVCALGPGSKYEQEVLESLIHLTSDVILADKAYKGLASFSNYTNRTLPILIEGITKAPFASMDALERLGPKASEAIPHLRGVIESDMANARKKARAAKVLSIVLEEGATR